MNVYKRKISFTSFVVLCLILSSCHQPEEKQEDKTGTPAKDSSSGILREPFGRIDSIPVYQYTLKNASGMTVKILNYGAIIRSIQTPDKNGQPGDVVLGFDSLSGYLQKNNPYIGALVGRYGNRIAHAKFNLDGKTYSLAANNAGNSLHGGLKGFDKMIWKELPVRGDSPVSLRLSYDSKDGEEGYPGNLHCEVVYRLTSDNALQIEYTATTDKPTPVNLTNHSYFNLSAGKDSNILGHEIRIDADRFTEVNDQLIPTGKNPPVKGSPMDFTMSKSIGRDIGLVKGGYDHNYVLNKKPGELALAVSVNDPASGRTMELYTTEPGVQFYTGNFLDGQLRGKNGIAYVKHSGFCLEAQHFPDSPNQPSFPGTILRPGETYHQLTLYKFSVK